MRPKNKICLKTIFTKEKRGKFSCRFLYKKSHFQLSKWKIIMFQKFFYYFFLISPAIYFGNTKFLLTLKTDSRRSLGPLPTFPFPGGVMGKNIWGISSTRAYFAPRDGPPAHAQSIAHFHFPAKKHTCSKRQCWFFHIFSYEVHKCLFFRNFKKNLSSILVFDL